MLRSGDYYAGKTLLLTGTTGFVGRAVLEALLDRLADVHKVYVLIRPRTDATGSVVPLAATLADEVLGTPAFDRLRERHGEGFAQWVGARVEPVAGDVSRPGLGLEAAAGRRLASEVEVIINCAALAVFDAPLDAALQSNARGPQHVLEFAHACEQRPFLAHVSTCYVNNLAGPVFETVPEPAARVDDPDPACRFDVDEELERLDAAVADVWRRHGSGGKGGGKENAKGAHQALVAAGMQHAQARGWNDTYTYTKALGEQVFERRRGELPGLILRPSIIESALVHPLPGWIDGFRMVDPLIVGFARGQIFEFPGHPDSVLDVIPVDRVVNALLMAIPWCHVQGEPHVFQVASGMDKPLRLAELRDCLIERFEREPLRHARDGARARLLPRLTFPDTQVFLDTLRKRYLRPLQWQARVYSPLRSTAFGRQRHATVHGRRGRLQRLYDMAAIYGPYAQSRVRYMTCNTRALAAAMSAEEYRTFPCLADDIDWRHYLQEVHIRGIECYLLNMRRSRPAGPGESYLASGGPADGGGTDAADAIGRWEKAQRVLGATRALAPGAARPWVRRGRRLGLQRAAVGLIRGISRGYLGLDVVGAERLPERGPCIFVSNHCSHVDTGVLLAALGGHARQVHPTAAADYWFRSRALGWLLHGTLAAIPFDRRSSNVPRALSLPAEVLRSGDSLIFYPEGTRSVDGNMRRFKSTVGLLALAAAVPVVPIHIAGTRAVLPKGRTLPRPGRVRVTCGDPLRPDAYLDRIGRDSVAQVARDLAHDAQRAVAALAASADAAPPVERAPAAASSTQREEP